MRERERERGKTRLTGGRFQLSKTSDLVFLSTTFLAFGKNIFLLRASSFFLLEVYATLWEEGVFLNFLTWLPSGHPQELYLRAKRAK